MIYLKYIQWIWICSLFFAPVVFAKSTETLDKPKIVQGTTFTAGSVLTKNEDGYLTKAILGSDQLIMDQNYKSTMKIIFPKGSTLIYNDPLNAFGEPNDRPDMVKEIRITVDVKVGRINFPEGSTLYITGGFVEKNGNRTYYADINGQIPNDMKVGKTTIPAKSNVLVEHTGKIKYAALGSWDWIEVK